MPSRKKIAFIHNNCKEFRFPVFEKVSQHEKLDVDFFLLDNPINPLPNTTVLQGLRIPFLQDFVIPCGLLSALNKKKYDYVISTDLGYLITYYGYYYSRKTEAKFILWNEQWANIVHPRRFLTHFLEKEIVKNAHNILSFGKKQEDFLIAMGATAEKLIHAPNVVPALFPPVSSERYVSEVSNCKYILCFGRLLKVKGQASVIHAFSKISNNYPDVKLLLAGEGPEYANLIQLVKKEKLEGRVIVPNKVVTPNQKYELINSSEFLVLASIRTRVSEAWGLVVNEAASLEKAVIVSEETGVAGDLIVNEQSGLTYEQNDAESLSKCMARYLDSEELAIKVGKNAKALIDEYYNVDTLVDKLLRAFDE